MYCFVILLLFNEMQMSVRRFSAIPHLRELTKGRSSITEIENLIKLFNTNIQQACKIHRQAKLRLENDVSVSSWLHHRWPKLTLRAALKLDCSFHAMHNNNMGNI